VPSHIDSRRCYGFALVELSKHLHHRSVGDHFGSWVVQGMGSLRPWKVVWHFQHVSASESGDRNNIGPIQNQPWLWISTKPHLPCRFEIDGVECYRCLPKDIFRPMHQVPIMRQYQYPDKRVRVDLLYILLIRINNLSFGCNKPAEISEVNSELEARPRSESVASTTQHAISGIVLSSGPTISDRITK
jgi:hypothetical protein